MKLPFIIERYMQKLKNNYSEDRMSQKEKWMIFLLMGLLAAVIILPAGKKDNDGLQFKIQEKSLTQKDDAGTQSQQNINILNCSLSQYEQYLSKQLEAVISQMQGAGEVTAWVTVGESSEKVFFEEGKNENNTLEEKDSAGGTRTETTRQAEKNVVSGSDGNPYVIKTIQPKIEGVFVLAEGAGDSAIKKNISEACQVLFGIDAHRIKVAKKKVEE